MELPTVELPDGNMIPILGFGTGSLWFKEDYSPSFDHATVEALKQALDLGFLHLDTAEKYRTEAEVGAAIRETKIARDKLWVTTKVLASVHDIPNALDSSLTKLGLEYVDLYLIHEPFWAQSKEELQAAWSAMEQVKQTGKAKSIGVSNFGRQHLQEVLDVAKERPAINQIEFNPYLQHSNLLAFHREQNIAVAAYAPLTPLVRAAPGPVDKLLKGLAQRYAVSPAAILLRWCFDQGLIVISTSGKREELLDYLQSFTFTLTPGEVERLSKEGSKKHYRSFYNDIYEPEDRS